MVEDSCRQTKQALANLEMAFQEADVEGIDVVCPRIYVTEIDPGEDGRAQGEGRSGTSMVEANQLIASEKIVEIEAVALIDAERGGSPSGTDAVSKPTPE